MNITKNTDKNIFIQAFLNLKWFEWVMFLTMIFIGGYYVLTDNTHPMWYLIVNYICSIMGVCCIFLCAHASWVNWIFGIVNTSLYVVILAYNHVFGTMALELFYYLPINIMGLIMWKKHLDNKEKDKCKTRVMSWKMRIIMAIIVILCAVICHYILVKIGGATAWFDAFVVAVGLNAMFYEVKRYADQYYLWIIADFIAVIQWFILADVIMFTKKSIYLVMAVIGLFNWRRMQKERNLENT